MKRTPFYNSSIKSAGWENQVLEVEFTGSGCVYQFQGVSERVWKEFLAVKEKGNYFQRFIRGNYPYECTYKPATRPPAEPKKKKVSPKTARKILGI